MISHQYLICKEGSMTIAAAAVRLRRNRQSEAIRNLVRETELHRADLIAPIFLIEGSKEKSRIASMPGIERLSIDLAVEEAEWLHERGIQAVALFPFVDRSFKSLSAEEAWNPDGLLARAIRRFKEKLPSLCVIADVALDPYTSHGHDGLASADGEILNDETIECLIRML